MDIFEKIKELLGLEYISDMRFEPTKSRVIKLLCELDLSQYSMKSLSDLFQYLLGENKEFGDSEEFKKAVSSSKAG